MSKIKTQPISPLEFSLLYNLTFYTHPNRWKNIKEIKKTDKKINQRYKDTITQTKTFRINPLRFTSDPANIHKYFDKLKTRGLIEKRTSIYKDKRNNERREIEWRLKSNKTTLWLLKELSENHDFFTIQDARQKIWVSEIFQDSDYFNQIPKKMIGELERMEETAKEFTKNREKQTYLMKYERHQNLAKYYKKLHDEIQNGGLKVKKSKKR